MTVNSQQSTVNSQQSTVNSQQSTVNSQQSTVLKFYIYILLHRKNISFVYQKNHKLRKVNILGVL